MVNGGYCLGAVCSRLIVVASLVAEHGLWNVRASVVMTHGLGCSLWLFLDQGSNRCPLHWQVDSSPLDTTKVLDFTNLITFSMIRIIVRKSLLHVKILLCLYHEFYEGSEKNINICFIFMYSSEDLVLGTTKTKTNTSEHRAVEI